MFADRPDLLPQHGSDFELFSTTSKGAIQGYGYVFQYV